MQCDQLELRIQQLLDERREFADDAQLLRHVDHCDNCRHLVGTYEAMLQGVDAIAAALPSDGFVQEAVVAARSADALVARRRVVRVALAIAAVLAIACLPLVWPDSSSSDVAQNRPDTLHEDATSRDRGDLPDGFQAALPLELQNEQLVAVWHVTGQKIATLPQTVVAVATHPGADRIAGHIRPLTQPVEVVWHALLRTLPVKSSVDEGLKPSDTGYRFERLGRSLIV